MKKKLNILIYFLFLLISSSSVNAQYYFPKEKAKYWLYRERLKNFMVRSNGETCVGCDIPAVTKDAVGTAIVGPDKIGWADTPWFLGYWMGTLAMEYQLLTNAGYSSTSPEVMQTKADLYGAIQAANRLDYEAEESWSRGINPACSPCGNQYQPCKANLNGFLLDDDIPSNFAQVQSIIDQLNGGLVPPPDDFRSKCIASAFTDYLIPGREASKDHLVGLFQGLALVKKCIPEYETWNNKEIFDIVNTPYFVKAVQNISQRIIVYLDLNGWIYRNPCEQRCVIGVFNKTNTGACDHPDPEKLCVGPQCCESGGAYAQFEAIGFAATNQFIQGNSHDPTLFALMIQPPFLAAWNIAINQGQIMAITLAATGNIWKIGPCIKYKEYHICIGWPKCHCCLVNKTINLPYPAWCSSTTAEVSDHLVNKGVGANWEHLYLLHKFLYGGGNKEISKTHYECLLNSAPCRGYDGSETKLADGSLPVPSIEWGDIDRLKGKRATYSSAFSRVDYMFYFNLYNLNNPVQGFPYGPIPIKQLAPLTLLKQDYTEYDLKNFMGINITAKSYTIANDAVEGKGRVTFSAGKSIQLNPGFNVKSGAYFNGYIDGTIGAMSCNDPASQSDCSGIGYGAAFNPIDTIPDLDSVVAVPDTAATFRLYNNHPNDVLSQNSQDNNPDVEMSIIPNPSMGLFTFVCNQRLKKIEVVDMMGNVIYTVNLNNEPVNMNIDISKNPPGIYMLKAQNELNIYTKKIVIQ